ncbi:hypothetical protein M0R45_027625 [Rubus argutus]|uniref:Uncharacterized protein n=1 Tax=Rubus argutus TaxID=59490 RepID=A0AAW1X0X9_RUBAR
MDNPRAKSATSSELVCTSGIGYHISMLMWLTPALRVTTSSNAGSRRKRSMLTCRVMLINVAKHGSHRACMGGHQELVWRQWRLPCFGDMEL